MQMKRAVELQQKWSGGPCEHPTLAKAYDQGVRTGSYICTHCGAVLSFRERTELLASRGRGAEDRSGDSA